MYHISIISSTYGSTVKDFHIRIAMENENLVAGKSNIFWDAWCAGYVGADAAINSALLTEQDRWPL